MTLNKKIKEIKTWKDPYFEKETQNDGSIILTCYPTSGIIEEWYFNKYQKAIKAFQYIANCPTGIEIEKIYPKTT